MISAELKPCPFCGGSPYKYPLMKITGAWCEHHYKCDGCGVEGPQSRSQSAALEAWNSRAQGLSQEDRAALEPHSKWLHLAAERLQKQQREYSIANTCEEAADAIDAILRRLGAQTT